MGCVNNFVSAKQLLNSGLEKCDIIEFNRIHYSHFGFYIGDGICVNVTGPDGDMSSSSSWNNFPKGMKQADTLVDIAGYDNFKNKVRVNNGVLTAAMMSLVTRDEEEAINQALEGLRRDRSGKVILKKPIDYDYNLIHNNCEYFATRCRYKKLPLDRPCVITDLRSLRSLRPFEGFSIQVR